MRSEPCNHGTRRPASLALRVTLLVGAATSATFLLAAALIEHSIEQHFARMDLGELQGAWVHVRAGHTLPELPMHAPAALPEHGAVLVRLGGEGGAAPEPQDPALRELAAAASGTGASPHLDQQALRIWRTPSHTWRGAVLRDGGARVLLATPIDFHLQYLRRLQRALWAGTVLASLVSVLVARLAVQQAHAPLRRISSRMRGLTSEGLQTRLDPAQVPAELRDLIAALNTMLERIDRSFQRLRNTSADIAHELRTPITNLSTQTQVALSKARDPDSYRETLYSNLEEFERMSAMIADMLFLAQAEHSTVRVADGGVDPDVEVHGLFEYFEAWAEESGVALAFEGDGALVRGDRALLRRALSNLVSNAIRHTARGGTVRVSSRARGSQVCIEVCNPGPDIDPRHLPHLFERFYRVDPSRQRSGEGAGLGLAIVKSVADAHGGEVGVRSQHGLTCFELLLPSRKAGPEIDADL